MRRLIILFAAVLLVTLNGPVRSHAQTSMQSFRSNALGVAFQFPAGWKAQESAERHSVTVAADADLQAIQSGQEAVGLVFTVTMSTFRQIGTDRLDDFGELLRRLEGQPNAGFRQLKVGGMDGVVLEINDGKTGIAGRSLIVSVGKRRVAIIRGVATIRAWVKADAQSQFDTLFNSISFFAPSAGATPDQIGTIMWQASDPGMTGFADIGASGEGTTVIASDPKKGLWTVSAAGVVQGVTAYDGIGQYGTLAMFRDGSKYIADPINHVVWLIQAGSNTPKKLLGGSVGVNRGQFGPDSPRAFAFGFQNTINILDNIESGTRIQVFGRGGDALTAWKIPDVKDGAISTDALGYVYVIGTNTPGIIKIGADGRIVNPALGRFTLADIVPTALAVDRYGAIYVATTDSGVIKLDADGKLAGVIGEPYDESVPPKPGQLGKPTALTIADDILYIGDSGKYPQVVAVALSGNAAVNAQSATVPMGEIAYGGTAQGEITSAAFVRTYTFTGTAGDVVTITAKADSGSKLDLYVDLLGTDGVRVASNDDAKLPGTAATDAQIAAFKLPVNGTYTIRVTRFGRETSNAVGKYTLTLTK